MIIRDPSTGSGAKVNDEGMIHAYSVVHFDIAHVSREEGEAYIWTASKDINTTDSIIWLRNDDTARNLVIRGFRVNSNAAGSWFAYCPEGTTADGDEITGTNLNRGSGKVALATCRADATGTTPANYIHYGVGGASNDVWIDLFGTLVLGYLDEFAIDITTEPTLAQATILGFYH
jgi:hypothetical protein